MRTKTAAIAGIPHVVFVGFHPSQEVRVVPRSVSLKGQNLPAAVPHTISNKRAGMSKTKLLCKLQAAKMLFCMQTRL